MPDPVSDQGGEILDLWKGSVVLAAVVGILVWGLIAWSVVRYRRRDDDLPSQTPHNIPLEVLYTAVPLVIVAVLFWFTVQTQRAVEAEPDEPDVVIDVVGFQWQWQFRYPDEGVVVTGVEGAEPTMVVPVGRVIRFNLATADVNHSFFVPPFLAKRDNIQRVDNAIHVEVTTPGRWTGRCAEFCGLDHYKMLFHVEAVAPEDYESWLDDQREVSEPGDAPDAGESRS
jgi:cytochrome c oxidase subunit II